MTTRTVYLAQLYMAKVQASAEGLRPGTLHLVHVLHDDDCPKLRGGLCQCEPIVRPLTRRERRAQQKRGRA